MKLDTTELRVGMRNFKTALAILICLLLYQVIPGNASYACIAALIAMQSTLEESFEQGRNRVLGTAIGGLFGGLFAAFEGALPASLPRILAVAAGVTVLIVICNVIGKRGAIVMGCVTYLAIVLGDTTDRLWLYSLMRVVDNTIGILVAVGVNLAIRPPKAKARPPEEPPPEEAESGEQGPARAPNAPAGKQPEGAGRPKKRKKKRKKKSRARG